MSAEGRSDNIRACPFVLWFLAYLVAMLIETAAAPPLSEWLRWPWLRYPIVVVIVASLVAIAVFQVSARHASCPWLPLDFGAQVALFGTACLVGLVAVYPAVNLRGEVLVPWRIIGILCLASVLAYLGLHLRSHKAHACEGANAPFLRGVSRFPFILLCAMVILISVVGIVEIVTSHS